MAKKHYVEPGEVISKELPYSEACMWMDLAGKTREVMVCSGRSGLYAQVRNDDGVTWGTGITMGEAGFYRDQGGEYYSTE